jgi:alkylation response protein AidB-like acyl-CoA dehydrogenase
MFDALRAPVMPRRLPVSKAIQAINRYKADLRDFEFLLFEQFKIQEGVLGQGAYGEWDADQVKVSLAECYRFVKEVTGPLNAIGDHEGCKIVDGRVKTPTGFKEAWQKLYEAGWRSIGVGQEHGGAGGPYALMVLVEELLSGSNTAFAMYPGLCMGAAEVIIHFGTEEQKALYIPKMMQGQWGGTMCLTEPHAGSDVGSARTSAKPNGDGSYTISGTKIYISGGDHDMAENVVHLVLARVEGAPAGTKGLTLFIVPRIRPNADGSLGDYNDVAVGALEHKMGINGNATCVMNFGTDGKCIGWPVGGESKLNQGMSQMFLMMNGARIMVGIQGVAVASSAYLNALEYAKDRKQGSSMANWKDATAPRVSIIEHADVRRMLLDMKARVEGCRALAVKLSYHQDMHKQLQGKDDEAAAYHLGQVDLLVPLVKAYSTDQAFRICESAIQTYGGAGFTRDYPVEQYCRDSKIFSIYEGTNHIQAMDLVGRKLGQRGGANTQAFIGDVAKFVAKHSGHERLGAAVKQLGAAQEALAGSAMKLLFWFQSGKVQLVPLQANRFLEMASELAVGWLLLEQAVIASEKLASTDAGHPDHAFYTGKLFAAEYYAFNALPGVAYKATLLNNEDQTAMQIPDAAFATV